MKMKRLFSIMSVLTLLFTMYLFSSCEKIGDSDKRLNGKTYSYWNGESGKWKIYGKYEFNKTGGVYYTCKTGTSSSFDTKGCALYYKMDGASFTIYHGVKGWKKEVRHTPWAHGQYFGDYILVYDDILGDGLKFELK